MRKEILIGTLLLSTVLTVPVYAAKNTSETTAVSEEEYVDYDPTEKIVIMWGPDGNVYGVPASAVDALKEEGYTSYETETTAEEEKNVISYENINVYDTATEEMYQDILDQLENNEQHMAYVELWDDAQNVVIPADILQKINELNGNLGIIFDEKMYEDGEEEPWPEQKYTILLAGDDNITVNESIDLTSSFVETENGYEFTCNADTTLNGMYMGVIYDKEIKEAGTYTMTDAAGNQIGEGSSENTEDGLWITFSSMRSGAIVKTGDVSTEEYVEEVEETTEETEEDTDVKKPTVMKESAVTTEVVKSESNDTIKVIVVACICVVLGGIGFVVGKKKKK